MIAKKFDELTSDVELKLGELDGVSGGRTLRASEREDMADITKKVRKKKKKLEKMGKDDEVDEFLETYMNEWNRWMSDIRRADADSDDILFSDYMKDYL